MKRASACKKSQLIITVEKKGKMGEKWEEMGGIVNDRKDPDTSVINNDTKATRSYLLLSCCFFGGPTCQS